MEKTPEHLGLKLHIPFTDLHQQYLDCKEPIDLAIASSIANSSFITGPDVTKFEKVMSDYVGSEDCAGTGSGTMALICALRALGIGPGHEVITTPHTFVSTTEAIVMVGANPVFVDINPHTHLIDLEKIPEAITARTKAVLFVDIYGQCPDLDQLRHICDSHGLFMVQDAAHSLGAQWCGRQIGSMSDITCFSFNPVKNLGAMGDAGCCTGSNKYMEAVRQYRDHGRVGRYNILELGYNARIDNMQSNIVLAKLPWLQSWINRKRQIVATYNQQLAGVVGTVRLDPRCGQGHYVYVIQTDHRDHLQQHLAQRGIQTNIHYAITTHQQPAFAKWYRPCPVAEKTVQEILSLPCRYNLTTQQIDWIISSVREFFA